MRKFLTVFCLLRAALAVEAGSDPIRNIHAVLIAGSNTWENYRHQADVAHAFRVLKDHGVPESNIITMAYDDIANSDENPFPGKMFNAPNGIDLYKDFKFDYKGDDVNRLNVEAVLRGEATKVKGGNGRVLQSTENDRVFIYFVDHGSPGVLAVVNDMMSAQQLNGTLQAMYDKKMFGELVFYLEACESGSMFEGILPSNLNILAFTASNSTEPSWGTYCDDPNLDTCLGDLFSTNWMEDSDKEDLTAESLQKQFKIVKKMTDLSNVMKYGDERIFSEVVANFQGKLKPDRNQQIRSRLVNKKKSVRWPAKDIPILTLESRLKRTEDPVKHAELSQQLEIMKRKRSYLDAHIHSLIHRILHGRPDHLRQVVLSKKPTRIHDLQCHHEVLDAYHNKCFNFGRNSYAMKVAGPLNNLCALGIPSTKIVSAIKEHCAHKNPEMIDIR